MCVFCTTTGRTFLTLHSVMVKIISLSTGIINELTFIVWQYRSVNQRKHYNDFDNRSPTYIEIPAGFVTFTFAETIICVMIRIRLTISIVECSMY